MSDYEDDVEQEEDPWDANWRQWLPQAVAAEAGLASVSSIHGNGIPEEQRASKADEFESRLLTLDQLEHRPLPEYLIEGVMVKNSLIGLYGPRGSGKSFLGIDFGAHIASGSYWQKKRVHQGRVLYVAAEGVGGLPKRIAAWKKLNNIYTVTEMVVHPYAVNLLDKGATDILVEVACRQQFVLVIIDTVARSMVEGDENSARDMGMLIEAADRVRRESGGATMLVHHSGKDTAAGMRGSSALEAAVDTVMEVRGEEQQVELVCRKQKDDAEFEPFRLALSVVEVRMPDGTSTTSCALTGRALDSLDTWVPDARVEEARRLVVQLASSTGISGSALHEAIKERLGVGRSAAYEITNTLVREGVISNTGSQRQTFYMLCEGGDVAMSSSPAKSSDTSSDTGPISGDRPVDSDPPSPIGEGVLLDDRTAGSLDEDF